MTEFVEFDELVECSRCGGSVEVKRYTEEKPGGSTSTEINVECSDCGVFSYL